MTTEKTTVIDNIELESASVKEEDLVSSIAKKDQWKDIFHKISSNSNQEFDKCEEKSVDLKDLKSYVSSRYSFEVRVSHYSKSQIFVQKFNFDKTPIFSRVFHPNFF